MALVIGIDPGLSGGIALISEKVIKAIPMPKTERDTFDYIHEEILCYNKWMHYNLDEIPRYPITFVLEKVHTFPGQGISSSGKFMQHYGFLRGLIIAAEQRFIDVSPQKWQRSLGILPRKSKTKSEHKNLLKQLSQQLFPHIGITLAIADALLLAEYGRKLLYER